MAIHGTVVRHPALLLSLALVGLALAALDSLLATVLAALVAALVAALLAELAPGLDALLQTVGLVGNFTPSHLGAGRSVALPVASSPSTG